VSRLDRLLLVGDVTLVVVLITAGEFEVATRSTYLGQPVWPGGPGAAVLVPVLVLPLLLRRYRPAIGLALGCGLLAAAALTSGAIQSGVAVVVGLVALYSGAAHLPRLWPSLVAVGVVAVGIGTRPGTITGFGDAVWFAGELVIPVVLGRIVALWRAQVGTLRRQRGELERLHEVEVAAVAAAERAVIARELHDVVAHAVSVVVIQAQVGSRAVRADPAAAVGALETIETSGRGALIELRRLLTVLADDDRPAPLVAPEDLAAVLDRVRAAGLDLSVDCDPLPDLPPAAGLAVHRVVQESLTNALKHAPSAPAVLRIRCGPDRIRLEVENALADAPSDVPGSARGLVGMRERLELIGGTFEAGPVGTRFRVRATVPIGAVP
jgi:signal transduction histidine kinase